MTDPYIVESVRATEHDLRHTDALFEDVLNGLKEKTIPSGTMDEIISSISYLRMLNEDVRQQLKLAYESVGCYKSLLAIAESNLTEVAIKKNPNPNQGSIPVTPGANIKRDNVGADDDERAEVTFLRTSTSKPSKFPVTEIEVTTQPDIEVLSVNLLDDKENNPSTVLTESFASNKKPSKKKRKIGKSPINPKELVTFFFDSKEPKSLENNDFNTIVNDGVECIGMKV